MKYSLLQLTQTILSRMDSDEINSITDTPEAQQVVKVIRTVFYDIVGRSGLPENKSIVSLNASTDATKPTLMTLPSNVSQIDWIRYDAQTVDDPSINMRKLHPLPLEDFLDRMYSQIGADNVGSFTHTIQGNPVTFVYRNDKVPDYYTTFDDGTIIFDSYDSEVDTTLQVSKVLAFGKLSVPFVEIDSFEPGLNEQQFALLLSEATSLAWAELKQAPNQKAEQSAKRNWVSLQYNKNAIKLTTDFENLPNFGKR